MDSTVPRIGRPSGLEPSSAVGEHVVHGVAGVVVVHGDLFEDDAALGVDVLGPD